MLKAVKIEGIYQLNDFLRTQRPVFLNGTDPFVVVFEVDEPHKQKKDNKYKVVDFYSHEPAE